MGPKNTGRTSTPMTTITGERINGWNDVRNSDGSYAGSNQAVTGGTKQYDAGGNYKGFRDNNGNQYDASGNLAPNHDPYSK